MVFGIVGRDAEVASLQAFVGDAGRTCAALVLEGEAGIGKSTLWEATVEYARAVRP
jgi:predicted ATPase